MPERTPAVAGRFYPAGAEEALAAIESLASQAGRLADRIGPWDPPAKHPRIVMLPHAGWIFSGLATMAALAGVGLKKRLVVLCPNHTGQGRPLGVWPEGSWHTPLGKVPVDAELAQALCRQAPFQEDLACHRGEHSIEVLLPFLLYRARPEIPQITPVCVGSQDPQALEQAGQALAKAIAGTDPEGIGIIVSSDMNHYESEETTLEKDKIALAQVAAENPQGLLDACRRHRISMCGCGPMALALWCVHALRREGEAVPKPAIVVHDSSGRVSRDRAHVVGYAGCHVF